MPPVESPLPPLYAIYDHPSDYPEEFVCRIWYGLEPEQQLFARGATLEEVRQRLPLGLVNLGRHKTDDPKVLEVWI
jgi:hypothetical protein